MNIGLSDLLGCQDGSATGAGVDVIAGGIVDVVAQGVADVAARKDGNVVVNESLINFISLPDPNHNLKNLRYRYYI